MQPRFPVSVPIPMPWSSFKPLLEQIREKVPLSAHLSIRDAQPVFFFWFQIIVGRSCLHAGRVQDLLDKATGQELREGIREKSTMESPWQIFPYLILGAMNYNFCNFYSFSRERKNLKNNNFIFPPVCKREKNLLLLKEGEKSRERS